MPRVSILLPTFNCANFLLESIPSALGQTYKDFEIIVIDDGSSDNTREVIARYQQIAPNRISYIYQNNAGLACARNTGIAQTDSEFIALLDADDIWDPRRLDLTVSKLDTSPSAGLVHAKVTRINDSGQIIDSPKAHMRYVAGNISLPLLLRRVHISCPTVLFRREACQKVGFFDEKLTRLGCEDRDLWLRISVFYEVAFVNKILAYYRVRTQSMSSSYERMLEAQLYVARKFCAQPQFLRLYHSAISRIYRDWGDQFLLKHDFAMARTQYLKSLEHKPYSFWSLLNLSKALMRTSVLP